MISRLGSAARWLGRGLRARLRRRRTWIVLAVAAAIVGAVVVATGEWVRSEAEPWLFRTYRAVPDRTVAIVPGASIRPGGVPSIMLQDRLEAARVLYRRGRVKRILVSGDNRTRHYNETRVMRSWLVAHGVPADHVYSDFAGFRTLDTMERAARVFRVRDAVVCTQAFHLYRSVFLARRAGIDAVGLIADRRRYRRARRDQAREYLARSLAFADSYLIGREPHFLGPPIPVDGPPQR